MVEAGYSNVKRFAPDLMLDAYMDVYRRLAGG